MKATVQIIGHLGNDPELRYTPAGQAVCNYSMATNRKYTNANGELITETTWFRVSSWGKRAEIDNQYLHKGQLVFVEGRLRPEVRIWTGNDGNPRASYELTAERVLFLGGNRSNSETIMEHGAPVGEVDESEIPF